MVSMDMLGFYSAEEGSQKSPIESIGAFKAPTVGDFVGMATIMRFRPLSQALDKAMKAASPELKTVVVDFLPIAPPDLLRSDHAPFIGIGVPALILSDTANFRNPNYHKAGDTFETLDLDRLTIAARGVVGGMYRLAGPPGTELVDLTPLGAAPPTPAAPDAKVEPAAAPTTKPE
jgi:Zn-dependent M28 family amino/carboxypeptidase